MEEAHSTVLDAAWAEHGDDLSGIMFAHSVLKRFENELTLTVAPPPLDEINEHYTSHPLNKTREELSSDACTQLWTDLIAGKTETVVLSDLKAETLRQVRAYIRKGIDTLRKTQRLSSTKRERSEELASEGSGPTKKRKLDDSGEDAQDAPIADAPIVDTPMKDAEDNENAPNSPPTGPETAPESASEYSPEAAHKHAPRHAPELATPNEAQKEHATEKLDKDSASDRKGQSSRTEEDRAEKSQDRADQAQAGSKEEDEVEHAEEDEDGVHEPEISDPSAELDTLSAVPNESHTDGDGENNDENNNDALSSTAPGDGDAAAATAIAVSKDEDESDFNESDSSGTHDPEIPDSEPTEESHSKDNTGEEPKTATNADEDGAAESVDDSEPSRRSSVVSVDLNAETPGDEKSGTQAADAIKVPRLELPQDEQHDGNVEDAPRTRRRSRASRTSRSARSTPQSSRASSAEPMSLQQDASPAETKEPKESARSPRGKVAEKDSSSPADGTLLSLVNALRASPALAPFQHPIAEESPVVLAPTDLVNIGMQIENGTLTIIDEVEQELAKMLANAVMGAQMDVTEAATVIADEVAAYNEIASSSRRQRSASPAQASTPQPQAQSTGSGRRKK